MKPIQSYGDAGVLILPWQDFAVPLYTEKNKNGQAIVDLENSAILVRRWNGGHCDYIADHASQGFDVIKRCEWMTPAVIQTPTSSRIYRWAATMLGVNNKGLITCTGQNLKNIAWADLCMYTCNDAGGKDITMVFFKLQDELKTPIYKVGGA